MQSKASWVIILFLYQPETMNSIPLILGLRYARGRKRNRFGSVVSAFSLLGMALGVASLITVLSVMNGFNREIQLRFQKVSPHISLINAGNEKQHSESQGLQSFLAQQENVQSWAPLLEGYALLSTDYAQAPAILNGIAPELDKEVVPLGDSMLYGDIGRLAAGDYGLVLGSYLARQLYLQLGDRVQVVLPEVQVTPAGIYPRQKSFTLIGVFDSGSQLDSELAYLHIEDARRIIRPENIETGYRVRLSSADLTDNFMESFQQQGFSDWRVQTWSTNYESLFHAMKMEKITVGLLLLIIVLVAAFNIVSGLVMMVSDKRSDMAVIRTMGGSTAVVMKIFVTQGILLGVGGILIGAVLGTLLTCNLSSMVSFLENITGTRVFDPSVFYVSFLPTEWLWSDFLWVISASFVLTLVATIIPAWQASKISPTEALSYKGASD